MLPSAVVCARSQWWREPRASGALSLLCALSFMCALKKKEAKTPRNPFPGQHGVRLAEGDPRYDLERARFESPSHPLHTKLTRVFGAGEENADALTLHLIGSSARLTCRPLRDLYYS